PEDLGRGSRGRVGEDVGMAPRHLLGDAARDVANREFAALREDPGEKDDLEQEIAELLAQGRGLAVVDRVDDLMRLLEQVAAQVLGCLLPVPGTAVLP